MRVRLGMAPLIALCIVVRLCGRKQECLTQISSVWWFSRSPIARHLCLGWRPCTGHSTPRLVEPQNWQASPPQDGLHTALPFSYNHKIPMISCQLCLSDVRSNICLLHLLYYKLQPPGPSVKTTIRTLERFSSKIRP